MQLPQGWEMKSLGELGECIIGLTYSPDNVVKKNGILVLRSSNIQDGRLSFHDNVFVNKNIPDRLQIQAGDILVCVRNGSRSLIGKSAVIESHHLKEKLTFGAFMSVYRTPYSNYIRHLFDSEMYFNQIKNNLGATINQITNKNLNSFTFPFPCLEQERNKIADIILTVNEKINLLTQKISENKKIKIGLIKELFSNGIGTQDDNGKWIPHSSFKMSPIGKIPKVWADGKVNSFIAELVSGVSVNSYDRLKGKNGKGILKTSAVLDGSFFPEQHKLIKEDDLSRAKTTVKADTLIISRMNTPALVGEFGYVEHDFDDLYLPDRLWMTVPTSKRHNVKALSYLLQHTPVKHSIKELATGTSNSMKNISKDKFLSVYLPEIPFDEMNVICNILSTIDQQIDLLEQQKSETRLLKKGLMQKLLTGKWRVPVDCDEEKAA